MDVSVRPARFHRLLTVLAAVGALTAAVAAPPAPAAADSPAAAASAMSAEAVTGAASAAVDPGLRSSTGPVDVIVTADPGSVAAVRAEVTRVGGHIARELPLVGGVAATVPSAAVARLAEAPGVRALTLDRAVRVQGGAERDPKRSAYHEAVGADDAWATGLTGEGTTVALVDTGVADVPDLGGRILPVTDDLTGLTDRCQNLSGEDGCGDSYGHGTFMAGIIAGEGGRAEGAGGIAPGARILSVKVAGRDGATDVSTVLAAIQWVVSFRDRYGIDVLNLSLGTDSTQSYRHDPLNYAVQRAWEAGIVVVVSAANLGPAPGTVTKPGDDPFVVTVGAVDDRGTPGLGDDRLPDFSSRGPTRDGFAKPDVVAPGAHLTSLRSPGSLLDETYPVAGDSPYRRGSGTSMAAAVVSGVAALVREARPGAHPDEVKHALRATARPVASDDVNAVGTGMVDAHAAALSSPPGRANAGLQRSDGLGSLAASRGSLQVTVPSSLPSLPRTLLTGGTTAQLLLWDPVGYSLGIWSAPTWYTSAHRLLPWHDVDWAGGGDNWGGDNWGGSSWYGVPSDEDSYGRPGRASAWYGAWG